MRIKLSNETVKRLAVDSKPYEVYDTDHAGFLLRIQPSGVMSYYYAYRMSDGTKRRYRIGRHPGVTPSEARKVAIALAGDVAKGIDPSAVKVEAKAQKQETKKKAERAKAATFSGFIKHHYREHCNATMKSGGHTIAVLESSFSEFNELPLLEITELRLTQWRNKRLKEGARPSGINRWIKALNAMLNRAVEWEIIPRNNLAGLKALKVDGASVIRYLSDEENRRLRAALDSRENENRERRRRFNQWKEERGLETLPEKLDAFSDHLKPIVLLALNTGMRRGEIFSLQWPDVDLRKRLLTVHGANAKSETTRHIPLNAEATAVLSAWRNQCDNNQTGLVFKSPKADSKKSGDRLDNINNSWRALLKSAGIENFRFHDLRHTFASWLVMKGVDLNTVRELMGHSDLTMTLRYAHLAPEHKAAAVAVLDD